MGFLAEAVGIPTIVFKENATLKEIEDALQTEEA
jgi:hypothetical protein